MRRGTNYTFALLLFIPALFLFSLFVAFLGSDLRPVDPRGGEAQPGKRGPLPVVKNNSAENDDLVGGDTIINPNDGNADTQSQNTNPKTPPGTEWIPPRTTLAGNRPGNPPAKNDEETERRRLAVRDAFKHAYNNYEEFAFGSDELKPLSKARHNWLSLGLSITDALDTMIIMDLTDELERAKAWVKDQLHFTRHDGSTFEITIRVLGGLEAAYDLTGDKVYLDKAEELGKKLLPAFDTQSGFPYSTIDFSQNKGRQAGWLGSSVGLAEIGTLQLEFVYLSQHTKNPIYAEKVMRVIDRLNEQKKPDGLYPIYADMNSGNIEGAGGRGRRVTLGAMGDSFYEYLLKLWLLTGKTSNKMFKMYEESANGIMKHMIAHSTPSNLTYFVELADADSLQPIHKMDHLACFGGGMLSLGAVHHENLKDQFDTGAEITRTCHEFYKRSPCGIGPEVVRFHEGRDFSGDGGAVYYILRPEAVESFYILYRLTGDKKYQEYAWEAFQAIEKHCRVEHGFVGLRDVTVPNPAQDDTQQSFFLAETLKYLYLTFCPPDVIPIDHYVFNTEAHPLSPFVPIKEIAHLF